MCHITCIYISMCFSVKALLVMTVLTLVSLTRSYDPVPAYEVYYKNLTGVSGMDRQICTEGHILASRGSPSDAKL